MTLRQRVGLASRGREHPRTMVGSLLQARRGPALRVGLCGGSGSLGITLLLLLLLMLLKC